MATASVPLQGPLWVCGPTGTGPANKKEIKWRRVPLATLTPAGSSSRYPTLQWCDDKDDKGSNKGSSKNGVPAVELVLVKVRPTIHVTEQEKQKKGGWLPSLSSSSASSLPRAHFAVDALEARAFEKALQYGLTPTPPKSHLLGFSSLVEAREWQEVAAAAAGIKGGKEIPVLDAGLGVGVNVPASAGVQNNAFTAGAPASLAPTVRAEAMPLPTLPYIDLPAAPSSASASSTSSTNRLSPSISSSLVTSSPSTTTTNKSLEERLHALHHADQVQRLAALRNLSGAPVDEATLRARHAALKGEGREGLREGGREGENRGQAFMEAATAGLSEEEMVEELLAQIAEDARLEPREGGVEDDETVRCVLARAARGMDDIAHLTAPSSTPPAPSEAVLGSLLAEAQALKAAAAAEEAASPSTTTAGATAAAVQTPPTKPQKNKKETEQDAKEESEDDPVLARCAAVLRALGKGMPAERGKEQKREEEEEGDEDEEEFEVQDGEEEDETQLAAVMELAHLWAEEGRTEGEGEKEKKEVK